jgi:hypothetical protein
VAGVELPTRMSDSRQDNVASQDLRQVGADQVATIVHLVRITLRAVALEVGHPPSFAASEQFEEFDTIEAIDDDMRALIEGEWPDLVGKLPPKPRDQTS